jgi:hypothetical protein
MVVFQAEANRDGGAYNVGPDFVSFVSLATSSAHVDVVRFLKGAGVVGGFAGGRGGERLVLGRGLRLFFEEDGAEESDDFWTGCKVDDGEFTFDELVETIERLMAAMAAFLLADTSLAWPCTLAFTV